MNYTQPTFKSNDTIFRRSSIYEMKEILENLRIYVENVKKIKKNLFLNLLHIQSKSMRNPYKK